MAKKKKSVRRAWTSTDVRELKSLAKKKVGVARISKALKRTVGATAVKSRIEQLFNDVAHVPEVVSVASPYTTAGASQNAHNGSIAYATVQFDRRESDIAKSSKDDLRVHFIKHFALGDLDLYQWLLLIPGHNERHMKQIAEVMADPGYPKTGSGAER